MVRGREGQQKICSLCVRQGEEPMAKLSCSSLVHACVCVCVFMREFLRENTRELCEREKRVVRGNSR